MYLITLYPLSLQKITDAAEGLREVMNQTTFEGNYLGPKTTDPTLNSMKKRLAQIHLQLKRHQYVATFYERIISLLQIQNKIYSAISAIYSTYAKSFTLLLTGADDNAVRERIRFYQSVYVSQCIPLIKRVENLSLLIRTISKPIPDSFSTCELTPGIAHISADVNAMVNDTLLFAGSILCKYPDDRRVATELDRQLQLRRENPDKVNEWRETERKYREAYEELSVYREAVLLPFIKILQEKNTEESAIISVLDSKVNSQNNTLKAFVRKMNIKY